MSQYEFQKIPKLTPSEVSSIIRTKHIKKYDLPETQRKEGKTNLYDFITTKRFEKVSDLITTNLEFQNAPSDLHDLKELRSDILQECLKTKYVECFNNKWYQSAKKTLGKNNCC